MHNLILTPISVESLIDKFALKTCELIEQKGKQEPPPEVDDPININGASEVTGLTVPTLRGYCQRNEIPYYKKGNRLYFFKSEILDWIRTGKQKTIKELQEEANLYLLNNKKGLSNGK